MGVAYYIALDLEDPGFDHAVDGKTVADAEDLLSELAQANDLPDVMSFFGMDGDELASILGEGDIPDCGEWHDSGEGQKYFERMADLVEKRADAVELSELVAELREFAAILGNAHALGAKWRLAMDI